MQRLKRALLLPVMLLSACAVAPYTRPITECPDGVTLQADGWWRQFGDPALEAVVTESLRCNVDLAKQAIAVERARLTLEQGDLVPAGVVSDSVEKPLGGGGAIRLGKAALSVAYEVDLWGRVRFGRLADYWWTQASEFERQAAALSLSAAAAGGYWQVAALTQQRMLARDNVLTLQQLLQRVDAAVQSGDMAPNALWQLQRRMLAEQQHVSELARQQDRARRDLAQLLDRPSLPDADTVPMPAGALPDIQADLPAALLARRPDVAASEARLKQLWAKVGQAQTEFMPKLTLTGALGGASVDLARVLSQPAATLAGSLTLPFVDWRTLDLKRQQAMLAYREAEQDYRRSVHQALREVDEVLRLRQKLLAEYAGLQQQWTLAGKSEREAEARYRAGATGRQDWYEAQLTRRRLEMQLSANRLSQLQNLAVAYKAFGGAPVAR